MIIPKSFILNFSTPIFIEPIETLEELKAQFRYDERIKIEDSGKITIYKTKYDANGFADGTTFEEKCVLAYSKYKDLAINKFIMNISTFRDEQYSVVMTPIHPDDPSLEMVSANFFMNESDIQLLIESPSEWYTRIKDGTINKGCVFDQRLVKIIEANTYFDRKYPYQHIDHEIF